MSKEEEVVEAHPAGERQIAGNQPAETVSSLDTFAGKVHVKWAPEATVSSLGLMPFFIEFLKTSGLFEQWVEDCPLHYSSGNAPAKRDVLGTLVLSVLAGHWRYAHINAIRADGINPELLGMSAVASEDSVRRGMKAMDEAASGQWLKAHLKASYEPLLQEPWILDVDTTVKPLYGHQQDAKVGYNPTKPGRPSHAYHSYFVANIRMVLDMEVQAGQSDGSSVCTTGIMGVPRQTSEVFDLKPTRLEAPWPSLVFLASLRLCVRLFFQPIHDMRNAVLDQRRVEVDRQAKSLVGQPQVGEKLLFVNRCNGLDRLDLDDHTVLDNQVGPESDIDPNSS